MTFGLLIENPDINRVILDENHPIYVAPPLRVANYKSWDEVFGAWKYSPSGGKWGQWQQFELRFQFPLTGELPPMLMVSSDHPLPVSEGGTTLSNYRPWPATFEAWPLGVPGAWSGFFVRTSHSRLSYGAGRLPNLSRYFMVVGYGVEPRPGDYGILVRNADGAVVFNSNSNVVLGIGASSDWRYIERSGTGSIGYTATYQLPVSIPSDCYCSVIPTQRYRRYNGEHGEVGMLSYRGHTLRYIWGGRSGTPAFTPMIWARPSRPVEWW